MKLFLSLFAVLAVAASSFAQESASIIRTNAGAPVNGTSEVQTLTIGGSTTGGTFKLKFDGFTTSTITWSATTETLLANINTALDALPNLADGEVVATDSSLSSGNGAILLTFGGNRAKMNVNAMTVVNALTGGTHTLVVTTSTPGVDATHRDAPLGALLVNTTNKTLYQNRGTALNPTWTEIVGIAVTDSASVAALVSDETGTGLLVFGTSPAIISPVITTGLTASGSASNDFSASTGTFKTSTGANTIGGDATVAAGKDLLFAAGDGAADFSLGTGITKTTTGIFTIGGATVFAANKGVTVNAGTSAFDLSGGTGETKTTTGLFTVSGGGVLSTTTLSGAGAISVVKGTTKLTTTGVGDALSLANGTDGQVVTIIHDVDGGSAVLTPTTKTGFSTITFTNVGESATLQYVTTRGWIILALNGAVAG